MTLIVIKPKTKSEKNLLTQMLKKMNIDVQLVEEPVPNYETQEAMENVEKKRGTRVQDSKELFDLLGI